MAGSSIDSFPLSHHITILLKKKHLSDWEEQNQGKLQLSEHSGHKHANNAIKAVKPIYRCAQTQQTMHMHIETDKITVERATGSLCQPHFTVAYHGQAHQACGQPLFMLWVNTSTSSTGSRTHTSSVPSNTRARSHIQAV